MPGMIEERVAPLRVLAIAGSLRAASMNRRLLAAAQELAPLGMEITIFELGEIPLYNSELDNDQDRPAAVERLKRAIAEADALLISTPEYNHNIPGVLQNAIDWVSRPAMQSPLAGKAAAIMGAAPGALGAVRAQQQLKLVLLATLAAVMPHPGVAVGLAREKFDAAGKLVHEPTRRFLAAFLLDLAEWAQRMRAASNAGRKAA